MMQREPAQHLQALHAFNRECLLPQENALLQEQSAGGHALLHQLRQQAHDAGLYGSFFPARATSLRNWLPLAMAENHSEFGAAVYGGEHALDLHTLTRHADPALAAPWLTAISNAQGCAAFAMTEPDVPGSSPQALRSRVQCEGEQLVLDGEKWFICRAREALCYLVLAQSGSAERPALSLLLVPADAPGLSLVRQIAVLGRQMGQGQLRFDNVRLSRAHLLGELHQGQALMQERLLLGRVLRSAQWLALGRRCYALLCQRLLQPRAGLDLAQKQSMRQKVVDSHLALHAAQAQLQEAAQAVDEWRAAPHAQSQQTALLLRSTSSSAKLACSQAFQLVADHALQVHGAAGLCDDGPLSALFRHARATSMMDGCSEALASSLGRDLLRIFANCAVEVQDADA